MISCTRTTIQVALAASAILIAGCEQDLSQQPRKVPIIPVSAAEVRRQSSFSYPLTYYGRIEPARRAALSFELAGKLEEVLVDEGGSVAAGQPLARLDTAALQADKNVLLTQRKIEASILDRLRRGERAEVIAAARAEVKRLEVELVRNLAEKDRAEKVYQSRAISRSDYEQAFYSYEAAKHSLEQARQRLEEFETGSREEDIEAQQNRVAAIEAQLKRLDVQFERSVLSAPFDGVCIRRLQDEGVTLAAGQIVVEINEQNQLEARFSVPRKNLQLVAKAKHLQINQHPHAISNMRAISEVDDMLRTVDVIIPLQDQSKEIVLPGQTATLVVNKRVEADCVEVPLSALVTSVRGLWSCYRLQPIDSQQQAPTYEVQKVEVSVLHTNGLRAFVSSTLPDRSIIMTEGVHRVVPGMIVRIVNDLP